MLPRAAQHSSMGANGSQTDTSAPHPYVQSSGRSECAHASVGPRSRHGDEIHGVTRVPRRTLEGCESQGTADRGGTASSGTPAHPKRTVRERRSKADRSPLRTQEPKRAELHSATDRPQPLTERGGHTIVELWATFFLIQLHNTTLVALRVVAERRPRCCQWSSAVSDSSIESALPVNKGHMFHVLGLNPAKQHRTLFQCGFLRPQ